MPELLRPFHQDDRNKRELTRKKEIGLTFFWPTTKGKTPPFVCNPRKMNEVYPQPSPINKQERRDLSTKDNYLDEDGKDSV